MVSECNLCLPLGEGIPALVEGRMPMLDNMDTPRRSLHESGSALQCEVRGQEALNGVSWWPRTLH